MINKSPAFQFYPDDWMSDMNVIVMTPEEEGHYIRLCAICWKEGYIPASTEDIQALLKRPCETLEKVIKCFYKNPKNNFQLLHKRLEKERKKQKTWRLKCSKGGRKSKKVKPLEAENKDKGTSTTVVSKSEEYCNTIVSVSNSVSNSVSKTNPGNVFKVWFEEDWTKYPRKAGNKKKAESCYLKSVTSETKRQAFLTKMADYVASVDDPAYLQHGETFFRNWEPLVVPEKIDPPAKQTTGSKKLAQIKRLTQQGTVNNLLEENL
jgi:uncharacterized protein YdaU (DUF1376 family)